jgi:phenylpyruvate tautomerase PptA (4-oxalocrotonate tautomerase family)
MPNYIFTVTVGSTSALRKKEIAEAITKAHCTVTGAPESYVGCTFIEVPEDGHWQGGKLARPGARLTGLVRERPEAVNRKLLLALGHAWADATGEPFDTAAMGLVDVPGHQILEFGALLGDAADD